MPDYSDTTGVQPAQLMDLEASVANLITAVLAFAGLAVFVMFLVGGFKYINSGGDPKAADAARGTLTNAITGLILIVLAYVILLVIQNFTGANVTDFQIR